MVAIAINSRDIRREATADRRRASANQFLKQVDLLRNANWLRGASKGIRDITGRRGEELEPAARSRELRRSEALILHERRHPARKLSETGLFCQPRAPWGTLLGSGKTQFIETPRESWMRRRNACWLLTATLGLVALLDAGAARAAAPRPEDLGVIPTPQLVTWTNDSLRVDEGTKILLPSTSPTGRNSPPLISKSGSRANGAQAPSPGPRARSQDPVNRDRKPKIRSACQSMKGIGLELSEAMAQKGYVLGIGCSRDRASARKPRGRSTAHDLVHRCWSTRGQKSRCRRYAWRLAEDGDGGVHDEFSYGQVRRWTTSRT